MYPVILYKHADKKTDRRRFYVKARGKDLEWRKCENEQQAEALRNEGFCFFAEIFEAKEEKKPGRPRKK